MSRWSMDQAKALISQIAIKSYYSGEAAGFRFCGKECMWLRFVSTIISNLAIRLRL